MKKSTFVFNLKDITEIGLLCGLAIVLDTFVKIPVSIGGGSVNIAMLPLIVISLHKGWFKGFIAGAIIFGLITCVIDGYGFFSYPFDYFIGFGSVFVVGLFKNKIVTEEITYKNYLFLLFALACCFLIRLVGATLSGIIFYGLTFVPSLIYQLTYIGPSFLILILLLAPMLKLFVSLFKRVS